MFPAFLLLVFLSFFRLGLSSWFGEHRSVVRGSVVSLFLGDIKVRKGGRVLFAYHLGGDFEKGGRHW